MVRATICFVARWLFCPVTSGHSCCPVRVNSPHFYGSVIDISFGKWWAEGWKIQKWGKDAVPKSALSTLGDCGCPKALSSELVCCVTCYFLSPTSRISKWTCFPEICSCPKKENLAVPWQYSRTQSGQSLCLCFNLNWGQHEGKKAHSLPSTLVSLKYSKQSSSSQTCLNCMPFACESRSCMWVTCFQFESKISHLRSQMVAPQRLSQCTSHRLWMIRQSILN